MEQNDEEFLSYFTKLGNALVEAIENNNIAGALLTVAIFDPQSALLMYDIMVASSLAGASTPTQWKILSDVLYKVGHAYRDHNIADNTPIGDTDLAKQLKDLLNKSG